MTQTSLQSIVNYDVILNNKQIKLLKFSESSAGSFKHQSVFLRQEIQI